MRTLGRAAALALVAGLADRAGAAEDDGNSTYGEEELNKCKFSLPDVKFGFDFLMLWMAILALVSAVLETLLHALEHSFRTEKTNLQFLRRLLKELTILGVMSFVLVLVRDFGTLTKNEFQLVELAHLWLFAVGVAFVVQAMQVATALRKSKSHMDRSFERGLRGIEERFNEVNSRTACCCCCTCTSCCSCCRAWGILPWVGARESFLIQEVRLWIMRHHFLQRNGLPDSFDFAKYLRKTLTRHVLEDMNISTTAWVVLFLTFILLFGIMSIIDLPPTSLVPSSASLVSVSVSGFLFLSTLALYVSVEVGTTRFMHIAGAPRAYSIQSLLTTAKALYQDEGTTLLDPEGCLTADEYRLDRILTECRQQDKIDSPEFLATNGLFDVVQVKRFREYGVLPLSRPGIFINVFRAILLFQSYIFGLSLLLILQYNELSAWAVALLATELLLHVTMVVVLFPRLIRNYALLSAVCMVDDASLDMIEITFRFQQEANESIYVLASTLYSVYERCSHVAEGKVVADPMAHQKKCIDRVWAMLDPKSTGRVHIIMLHKRLEKAPFRSFMALDRLKKVLRALNGSKGIQREQVQFLIKGFIRMKTRERSQRVRVTKCFPDTSLECARCEQSVHVDELADHADICFHRTSVRRPVKRSKMNSELFSRGASYGLLRPFVLEDKP